MIRQTERQVSREASVRENLQRGCPQTETGSPLAAVLRSVNSLPLDWRFGLSMLRLPIGLGYSTNIVVFKFCFKLSLPESWKWACLSFLIYLLSGRFSRETESKLHSFFGGESAKKTHTQIALEENPELHVRNGGLTKSWIWGTQLPGVADVAIAKQRMT